MKVEKLIGNYQSFFSGLLNRMKKLGIHLDGIPMSHLLYRAANISQYISLRDELKKLCKEYVENQFNGRAIAMLILKEALLLEDGFKVEMIELPAPREIDVHLGELESAAFVMGEALPAFIKQHQKVLSGVKDYGTHNKPAFITFDNDKTAMFYESSIKRNNTAPRLAIRKIGLNY